MDISHQHLAFGGHLGEEHECLFGLLFDLASASWSASWSMDISGEGVHEPGAAHFRG